MGQSKKEAVDMALMAQNIEQIKSLLEGTAFKVDQHDIYINEQKGALGFVKWAVGAIGLAQIIGFVVLVVIR